MTPLSPALLQATQAEIVRLFTEVYTPPGGVPVFALRARTGERPPFHSMLAEFGDWAPFLYMAGAAAYVREQTEILARASARRLTLPTPYAGAGRWLLPTRENSFHYTDLLLGLLDLHALGWRGEPAALAGRIFSGVLAAFVRDGWICQWRLPRLRLTVPVAETTGALFIELALDLAEAAGEPRYQAYAVQWGDRFLSLPFFAETGLFPEHVVVRESPANRFVRRRTRTARLAKHNLAPPAAFLALWTRTRAERYRHAVAWWHQGVRRHFLAPSGGAAAFVRFDGAPNAPFRAAPHIKNHGLADLLCDAAFFLRDDDYLATAREVADFWLTLQSPETGLLPFAPGDRASYLDGQTDWAVALLKLAELTREPVYRAAAERLVAGAIRHHATPRGFVNGVDVRTGEIRDDLVETRYVALLLKPVLYLQTDDTIYPAAPAAGPRIEGGLWWRMLLDR